MTSASGDDLAAVMDEYGEAADRFERYGGYEIDYRVDMVLTGLGVAAIAARPSVRHALRRRESARRLALLLLQSPDVLLLDEPTNHLDFATMNWLEEYLQGYRGAILVVSHDREFLNRHRHRDRRDRRAYAGGEALQRRLRQLSPRQSAGAAHNGCATTRSSRRKSRRCGSPSSRRRTAIPTTAPTPTTTSSSSTSSAPPTTRPSPSASTSPRRSSSASKPTRSRSRRRNCASRRRSIRRRSRDGCRSSSRA